jgi:ABC-type lipoprotein release transport system permease subunit
MLRNYLKIAYYNFFRNKTFSLINVVGLTLGLVCTILVFLWINYELSFDNYHNESDRIYLKGMLQSFAYKINISIWHFIVSTVFISILVVAAVLIQSLQAARRNPLEALRYE